MCIRTCTHKKYVNCDICRFCCGQAFISRASRFPFVCAWLLFLVFLCYFFVISLFIFSVNIQPKYVSQAGSRAGRHPNGVRSISIWRALYVWALTLRIRSMGSRADSTCPPPVALGGPRLWMQFVKSLEVSWLMIRADSRRGTDQITWINWVIFVCVVCGVGSV